jgi:hypothetical protein
MVSEPAYHNDRQMQLVIYKSENERLMVFTVINDKVKLEDDFGLFLVVTERDKKELTYKMVPVTEGFLRNVYVLANAADTPLLDYMKRDFNIGVGTIHPDGTTSQYLFKLDGFTKTLNKLTKMYE